MTLALQVLGVAGEKHHREKSVGAGGRYSCLSPPVGRAREPVLGRACRAHVSITGRADGV